MAWKKVLSEDDFGIADDDALQVDGAPNVGEYARFTADGLEGRTEAQFKTDYNLEIGTDVLAQQTIGIADDNLVEVDGPGAGAPANGEYAKWTANGLEGKSTAEVLSDISAGVAFPTGWSDTNITGAELEDLSDGGQTALHTHVGGGAAHAILDGGVQHTDAALDAVTQGSLIVGNYTPEWDELVIGAANTFLQSDGADPSWGTGGYSFQIQVDTIRFGNVAGPLLDGPGAGDDLALTGELDISGHLAVGGSAALDAQRVVNVEESFGGVASALERGISSIVHGVATSGSVEGVAALYFEAFVGSTTGTFAYVAQGMAGWATKEGANDVYNIMGCEVGIQSLISAGGSVTNSAYALWARSLNSGGLTSPLTWGVRISDFSDWGGSGDVTYGLRIDRFDASSTPTRWPIFYGDHGGTEWFSVKEVTGGPIVRFPSYTNASRPTAANAGAGAVIYNSDDGGLNVSNGAAWRGPAGGWANT